MPLRSAGTGAAGGASLLGSTTYLVPRPAAALAGHDTRNLNPERPSMTRAKDETGREGREDAEQFEVRCPVCKKVVKVNPSQAEREMRVRCPQGHDVPLVKAW